MKYSEEVVKAIYQLEKNNIKIYVSSQLDDECYFKKSLDGKRKKVVLIKDMNLLPGKIDKILSCLVD